MLKTRRNYAQVVAVAVTTLAPLVASAATSLLGASIRRFNALPRAERKKALRESLASYKATAILGPNALIARQVVKSETALDALLDTLEEQGGAAHKAGGEIAHAAAREATSATLARTAKKNGIMSTVGRQMLTVKSPGARAYKTTVEAFIAANLDDRLTVQALKAWLRAGASKGLTLYAPDGISAYTLTLDRPRTTRAAAREAEELRYYREAQLEGGVYKNPAFWDYQDAMGKWRDFAGQQIAGTPKDWRAAGLISADHPALQGGQWMAVRFTHTVHVAPPSHFAPADYSRQSKSRRKNPKRPRWKQSVNRARRNPAIRPSEEPGGKLSHDADFIAGFAAGQRTLKRKPDASYIDALKAYKRVSMKHGQLWLRGYVAAIDAARGAYAQPGVEVARLFGLVP